MLGLELHRSWARLAALAKALNGQRLLREGPKLETTAVETCCVLKCWSLHHQACGHIHKPSDCVTSCERPVLGLAGLASPS